MVDEVKNEKVQKNKENRQNDVIRNLSLKFFFNAYYKLSVMM